MKIYLLFQKSLKKGCDNLYFHLCISAERQTSFSRLASLSRRVSVNPSIPTFDNINLTEAMIVIFLLLGNSIKNNCKNLYFQPKPFKITFKSSWHLTSISLRFLVTQSTDTFPNINLTKKMTNLLIVWKITEEDCDDLYFSSCTFNMSYKSFSFLTALSRRRPCKFVYPHFWQYQSDRNRDRFNCWFETQSKMAARISICTLNPLKLSSSQIHIWCQFAVLAR